MRFIVFLCILASFLFPSVVQAKVVINEFSSATSKDWIELYNDSSSEADLKGYVLKDTAEKDLKSFSSSLVIPPEGYCGIEVSNRLNNKGDKIELFKESQEIDCVSYGDGNGSFCKDGSDISAPSEDQSAARIPNAIGSWQINSPTYEYSNNDTLEPASKNTCFSVTPAPKVTPAPAPSATPTPSSTPEVVSTEVPTSDPKKMETPRPDNHETKNQVLGVSNDPKTPEPYSQKKKLPFTAIAFLFIGFGFISFSFYPLVRKLLKKYNKNHVVT